MRLPAYPDYSPSGSANLHDLPSHWVRRSLQDCAAAGKNTFVDGPFGSDLKSDEYVATGVPLIQLNNVAVGKHDLSNLKFVPEQKAYELIRHQARPGDLVFAKMADPVARAAVVSNKYAQYVIVADCVRLSVDLDNWNANFIQYWVNSAPVNAIAEMVSSGTTRIRVSLGALKKLPIAKMPLNEQKGISAFLDRETAKIDALIAEQEKLLTLLAEKRQATISHAVTCGLNPDAPMKDSGVPWLGEVPAHWGVGKAGFYVTVLPGYAFPSTGFSDDENGVRLLRGVNVGVNQLRWDDVVYWHRTADDGIGAFQLDEGDVIIGMDRPLISGGMRVATVTSEDLPCLLLQRVAKIQAGPLVDSRFIMRLIASKAFEAHFTPETTGVSVPHISGDQISNFVIPVPDIAEQRQICEFLESELNRLDALNSEAWKAIVLLKERRSALIAAAVTGKIDVRGSVEECGA